MTALPEPPPPAPFPLRTCVLVAVGFLASAAAFHAWPHDPTAVLAPVTGVEDPLALHPELRAAKAAGETRILFVGASLTFGYPYGPHASYARVLDAGLAAVFPGRRIVVREIAKPAIDSTRVAAMVEAVLPAAPDAVWVDFGGNEVGARLFAERELVPGDWLGRIADHATRSRGLFLALAPDGGEKRAFAGGDVIADVVAKLLQAKPAQPLVGALPVSAADRAALAARTCRSMRRMAAAARAAGVPLAFLVSPYDLAGSWPRGMVARAPEIDALALAFQRGRAVDPAAAGALAARHPARADAHFVHGQALLAQRDFAGAGAALARARDLDPAPLHTIGEVEAAIVATGAELGLPVLAPADATFLPGSRIPDPECYLDAAHWNLAGARVGAAWLAERLAEHGVVPPLPAGWREPFLAAADAYLARTVDAAARAYCEAEMQRATGAYHMLFGNVRDAVLPLADGVAWFTGIVEGPRATMWFDWALRALFCAAAAADRVPDLEAGTYAEQSARLTALADRLWDASRAGRVREFVGRILDGEDLEELTRSAW